MSRIGVDEKEKREGRMSLCFCVLLVERGRGEDGRGEEGGRRICKRMNGWMPGKYMKRRGKGSRALK